MSVASLEPIVGRHVDLDRVRRALATARRARRSSLLEPEGLEVLDAIGIAVPDWLFAPIDCLRAGGGVEPRDLALLHGERVVVKVVADAIAHKTELGGVAVVARDHESVLAAMGAMVERLAAVEPAGCLVSSFVDHEASLAGELLVALRWTRDFGSIVVVGAGGLHAELLARDLRPGTAVAMVPTSVEDPEAIEAALRAATVVRLATESQRGRPPLLPMAVLVDVVERLLVLGRACLPGELLEIEMNPMAVAGDRLVALDVLARLPAVAESSAQAGPPRREPPSSQLDHLLRPRSLAIVGHVILESVSELQKKD
ncbi:MAG TPA: acetate--CoA ligase family protein [Candidatus Limnocylindrales bacterium]|nr:acetate--CoA ligase family protein [Candidatus Limnocylindrales bacterium]